MGRAERLKLLFGDDDGSLLQKNTRLKVPTVSVVEVPETETNDTAVKEQVRTESIQKVAVQEQQTNDEVPQEPPVEDAEDPRTIVHGDSGSREQKSATHQPQSQSTTTIESNPASEEVDICVSGSFCPLITVSRYPYRFVHGGLSQPVASAFFDGGKFWKRKWNMYVYACILIQG